MRHDVHVVTTVLAVDQVHLPNVLAINAASAALTISDIPWAGPVGAVRMGRVDGNLLVNPTEQQMEDSDLDLLVAGHADGITMVESGSRELSEETLTMRSRSRTAKSGRSSSSSFACARKIGRGEDGLAAPERIPEIDEWMHRELGGDIRTAVKIHEKKPRNDALRDAKTRALDYFQDRFDDCGEYVAAMMESMVKSSMRSVIVDEGVRADGRA
jgi:polyribonucleotide nucleotidyltransferase